MGVPSFYAWLLRCYDKNNDFHTPVVEPDSNHPQSPEQAYKLRRKLRPNGYFDNLYIDMNGLIHPCSHPEFGEKPKSEEEMLLNICKYLDRIVFAIQPQNLLYLAIDGVAPRAKMNQQRARRFS